MLRAAAAVVLGVVCSGAWVGGLSAHDLERTQVTLTFSPDGRFVLEVANDPTWLLLRLETFAGGAVRAGASDAERDARLRELGGVFLDRIVLFVDGREVRPETVEYHPPSPVATPGAATPLASYRLHGRMPDDAKTLRWLYGLVIDPYPLVVRRADGQQRVEWIAGSDWSDVIDLSGQFRRASRLDALARYAGLGYLHILPRGVDHILFVVGLLLLNLRLRPVLLQVTTFTLAHSLTLALTVYGVVSLPARVVEPLIALSIAYVAIENLWTSDLKPWRLALVFGFGLLHGMGFAGVLSDLQLPRGEFLAALLGFNLGVEAGQLTVIALAAAFVAWHRAKPWYRARVVVPASLAIAGIGVYWTIARVFE